MEIIDFEETIEVCKYCFDKGIIEEVRETRNWLDGFQICDICGKDNFIRENGLKTIKLIKQQITRYKHAK